MGCDLVKQGGLCTFSRSQTQFSLSKFVLSLHVPLLGMRSLLLGLGALGLANAQTCKIQYLADRMKEVDRACCPEGVCEGA